MHFINYIWPIVVITAVNADESTLPQGNDAAQVRIYVMY